MKKILIAGAIVIIAAVGWYWWNMSMQSQPVSTAPLVSSSFKNGTYTVEGDQVTLVNGTASTPVAPDSAANIVTTYFGNDATGDLNGDGKNDVAFILTQNLGGSGTFYYVAVALATSTGGFQGTNAVFLGDRIAPQSTEIKNGQLIVNYADRAPGAPMTSKATVGASMYLKVTGMSLRETIAGPAARCGGNKPTALQCVAGYHCSPIPGSSVAFSAVGGMCAKD